ncbi:uncharacterized protein [Mytilus edulis]|uniref:uncharacterized protein n=1 Tax=Mytilus edulis TaxID=6550 RepID=UPI0039EDFE53
MMKTIVKLGNAFINAFLTFFVVGFWNTAWNIQDRYIYPDDPVLSNGLSLSCGIIGICLLALLQFSFTKLFQDKHILLYLIFSRVIAFLWAFLDVCHWRGLWNFIDIYTADISPLILLLPVAALLVVLRSIRNVIVMPYLNGYDRRKDMFFIKPMIFSKVIKKELPFVLDIILSVSILWSLVILFWRNTWKLFDLNLYPDDKTKTLIWSAVISIGVQIFIEIVSLLFEANVKKMKTIHYLISLIIQDIFFTIAGIGNVAMWRTYWILVDMLIEMSGSDIGLPCICVGSFIILACTCSCRSGGLLMDGDLRNWYQLPNDIIGSIKYVKVPEGEELNLKAINV